MKSRTWIPMGEGVVYTQRHKPVKTQRIEQVGYGIIGAWLTDTGEGVEQVDRICKAVSCHDDLLAALIRLREWVRHPGVDDSPENEAVIEQAEAAIAKAGGFPDTDAAIAASAARSNAIDEMSDTEECVARCHRKDGEK